MPTGYIADIAKDISFEQFALGCARAFGATITMRDDPAGTEIPVFVPSDYHRKQVEIAHAELAKINAMSFEDSRQAALADYLDACERNQSYREERQTLRTKYEAMLVQAEAWEPPTPDHVAMKEFMVDQIKKSIDWDCGSDHLADPEKLSGDAWRAQQLQTISESLAYHTREHEQEVERTRTRNAWVDSLKASLV